ncbi:MAG: FAD-dependent oxidoreductase [bacterium]|nr:FAD-dependent oxidoreductase [bacterium]
MTANIVIKPKPEMVHEARQTPASLQDSMAGRYALWVQVLAMAAFTLAFLGWLNESYLFLWDNPIWLNRYTEYAIILGFGIWRIAAERNSYTRRRLIVLVFVVSVFWWLIPWLMPMFEPHIGHLGAQPIFPSLHTPGTMTFFLILLLVLLFGRRVICGWGCPCVGIRETVGFPFRHVTLRGEWVWRLRHTKWFFFVLYVGVMAASLFPPNSWSASFIGFFYMLVVITYFGSFLITPLTGNRFYCRALCPFGATFGLLNHAGYYDIEMARDKCNDCRRCEQVCDMGIPVWRQGMEHGRITGLEDCMGCARCVVSCPTDALEIRDVRNLFAPKLVQNGSHLLKKQRVPPIPRQEPISRPVHDRMDDWREIAVVPKLSWIKEQASRCLDCGVPGCRSTCPLSNRIPDWLKLAAQGDIIKAAQIAHSTSPMPEICGRLCPQYRLCEAECTLARGSHIDQTREAVAIGALEQAITDTALAEGWRPQREVEKGRGHKVAIIGSGPAGLACAERLAEKGVQVTIYDKAREVGGQLSFGIPSFKLERQVLKRRIAVLEGLGVTFRLSVSVDRKAMTRMLEDEDAVFLGFGAHKAREITLPGTDVKGVWKAWNFLCSLNNDDGVNLTDKHVLVLGGGDTAMDCARSALRLGASSVTIAYRGSEVKMRAGPKEIKTTREEGAKFAFNHRPIEIMSKTQVSGVLFKTEKGERILDCDTVILSFGFIPAPPRWLGGFDVKTDEGGHVITDGHGRTSNRRIYAGGDNVHGPDLVVTALAGGYRAAGTILEDFSFKDRIRRKLTRGVLS